MNVGQADASNLKALVGHSNETSHGEGATAGAAKDRQMANSALLASYALNKQSGDWKSQQSHGISGTADAAKGVRDHHELVLDPLKDACKALCMINTVPLARSRKLTIHCISQ